MYLCIFVSYISVWILYTIMLLFSQNLETQSKLYVIFPSFEKKDENQLESFQL
jgi:hypothetical protein